MRKAVVKIKTDEEQARLDAIFAEIEVMEGSESITAANARTQKKIDEDNQKARIDRLANLDIKEFIGNVKANIGNGAFKTKWEQILSQFIITRLSPLNDELNILRNFTNAVDIRLQKAEKTAKEQDNHHYYKIFAEGVKELLEKL